MELIVPGANYEPLGLGNTRWSENYIKNIGLTNAAKIAAIRAFYTGMTNNNLTSKFAVIRLFNTGNAIFDKLNLIKPYDAAGNYRCSFSNDLAGAHTNLGFTPSDVSPGRFAISEYQITSAEQLTNFHMHVFNKTADAAAKYMIGTFMNAGGTSLFMGISRNASSKVQGGITTHNASVPLLASPDGTYTGSTGMLSLNKAGATQKLYHAGTVLASNMSMSPAITVSAAASMYEGTANVSVPSISTAQIFMVAYGSPETPMTDSEVSIFNTLIVALESAMAAA